MSDPVRWEDAPPEKLHEAAWSSWKAVFDQNKPRTARLLQYAGLYRGRMFQSASMLGLSRDEPQRDHRFWRVPMRERPIASAIDTLVAIMLTNQVRAQFVPDGGDYKAYRACVLRERATDAIFYSSGFYEKEPQVIRDAGMLGTGAWKWLSDGKRKRVRVERAIVPNLFVDFVDALHGNPKKLYQQRIIDRPVIAKRFGGEKKIDRAIAEAAGPDEGSFGISELLASPIEVADMWCLPSEPGAKDGRHVVTLDTTTLLDEPWKEEDFPFAFLHLIPPLYGFWGTGLYERLQTMEVALNRWNGRLDDILHYTAGVTTYLPRGSNINPALLDNSVGAVIEGDSPPVRLPAPQINSEFFLERENIRRLIFAEAGISPMDASAVKTPGVEAAVAIRALEQIASRRQIQFVRGRDAAVTQSASQGMRRIRDVGTVEIPPKDGGVGRKITWDDLGGDDVHTQIRIMAASRTPDEVPGRIQRFEELLGLGVIDKMMYLRAARIPDLDFAIDSARAAADSVENDLERMIEFGEDRSPNEYGDPFLAMKRGSDELLRAAQHNASDEIVDRLRAYVDDAISTIERATQPDESAVQAPGQIEEPTPGAVPDLTAMPEALQTAA